MILGAKNTLFRGDTDEMSVAVVGVAPHET
jgi:hypothetical protein